MNINKRLNRSHNFRMSDTMIQQSAQHVTSGKRRAKLTESDVISIFQAKATRIQATTVGRSYGVSEKAIRDIWSGRTWAKETWHLSPSRTLIVKRTGRPKGSRDSRPRQRRTQHRSLPSVSTEEPIDADDMWGQFCELSDESDESEIRSSHQTYSLPCWPCDDAVNTCTSAISIAASDLAPMTLDEQLDRWGGEWCDPKQSDPFENDWQPAPWLLPEAIVPD